LRKEREQHEQVVDIGGGVSHGREKNKVKHAGAGDTD
jgi:hypothetical protein